MGRQGVSPSPVKEAAKAQQEYEKYSHPAEVRIDEPICSDNEPDLDLEDNEDVYSHEPQITLAKNVPPIDLELIND